MKTPPITTLNQVNLLAKKEICGFFKHLHFLNHWTLVCFLLIIFSCQSSAESKTVNTMFSLYKGVKDNSVNNKEIDLFIETIDERDKYLFHQLLDQGIDIDGVGSNGWTPLGYASAEGRFYFATVLLDKGAKVDFPSNSYRTPYLAAAAEGHIDLVKLLEDRGASTAVKVGDRTPIALAASEGHTDVVSYLLNGKPSLSHQKIALILAAKEGHLEVVELLTQNDEINSNVELINKVLLGAVSEGRLKVVSMLVNKGAEITANSTIGTTALSYAAKEGHIHLVDYLLANGANPNSSNQEGWTALHFATVEGNLKIIEKLILNKSDIELSITSECVNMGKKAGSKIVMGDWTALLLAVGEEKYEATNLLLGMGSNVNAKANKTVYLIERKGEKEISVSENPIYVATGWTPLMEAVEKDDLRLVELLIAKGANINSQTSEGISAISIAKKNGNDEIIKLLK